MGGLAIAWGYGIAILVPVLAFANVSGAHINPAITIGLASAGYFPWAHVAQYILAQLIGAIIGQLLVVAIYKEYFAKTNDGAISLGAFQQLTLWIMVQIVEKQFSTDLSMK